MSRNGNKGHRTLDQYRYYRVTIPLNGKCDSDNHFYSNKFYYIPSMSKNCNKNKKEPMEVL